MIVGVLGEVGVLGLDGQTGDDGDLGALRHAINEARVGVLTVGVLISDFSVGCSL